MESKLKQQCQDSVGELYENMLLKEGGFPHLPNPVFVPEPKTKQSIVGLLENKSDAWNDAGTMPDHPCLCRTRVLETDWPEYYNYWNGNFWGLTTATKENAIDNKDVQTTENNIQWREVQS